MDTRAPEQALIAVGSLVSFSPILKHSCFARRQEERRSFKDTRAKTKKTRLIDHPSLILKGLVYCTTGDAGLVQRYAGAPKQNTHSCQILALRLSHLKGTDSLDDRKSGARSTTRAPNKHTYIAARSSLFVSSILKELVRWTTGQRVLIDTRAPKQNIATGISPSSSFK